MSLNGSGALAESNSQEFTFSRRVRAPRELVFRAWTEYESMKEWWGPKGFTWKQGSLDLRPGGRFHYCMLGPDGRELWGLIVFGEIDAPVSLEFTNSFSDAEGKVTRAPFSENWPLEVFNRISFTEEDGLTTVSLRGRPLNASDAELDTFVGGFNSMKLGFGGTFDQLEDYLGRETGK